MKIAVIGTGYVGLVTGACFADLGIQVTCVDIDEVKIKRLQAGEVPIYEPGLGALMKQPVADGRLTFTSDTSKGVDGRDAVFIAVGTPPDEDGSAELRHVLAAARSIAQAMTGYTVIVNKSTVPVGTADKVSEVVAKTLRERGVSYEFAVVSNPEFLKEGAAVADFMRPDRIVLGIPNGPSGHRARAVMERLYEPLTRNHQRTIYMDVRSAELTKYAANAMLATRISFMNELANLADEVGADIEAIRHGIGSDSRIGFHFLYAGTGYGGSCFPKDVRAIQQTAKVHGVQMHVVNAVEQANEYQKHVLIRKITRRLGEDLRGMHFALWGLAFKPDTDDMRDAPSRSIVRALLERGASVAAYDPVAVKEAQHVLRADMADRPELFERLVFAPGPGEALEGADALVIATEWKLFRSPDFTRLRSELRQQLVFDGRNLYSPQSMHEAGLEYHAIGRPMVRP